MTHVTASFRRLINRVRRRKRRRADVHIRLPYCCVCQSTEGLSQHHEPPLVEGGNVAITICGGCKKKRHGKGNAKIREKIRAEIKKRVGFI